MPTNPTIVADGPAVPDSSVATTTFDAQYEAFNLWEKSTLRPGMNALATATYNNALEAVAAAVATLLSQNAAATSASLAQAIANAPQYTDTSTTSLTIGTGTKVLTTAAGKSWGAGMMLTATNGANSMTGAVSSYVGTTLTLNVTATVGSGTFASWSIGLAGLAVPDVAGKSGQFLSNNGIIPLWATVDAKGRTPISALTAFDLKQTANVITDLDGSTYLKTGVIAPAATYPLVAAAPAAVLTNPNSYTGSYTLPVTFYEGITGSSGSVIVAGTAGSNVLYRSTDGIIFTTVTPPNSTGDVFQLVHWNGSLFMAIAASGKCWTSPEGTTWTQRTTLTSGAANWRAIGAGGGRWVAAASGTTTVNWSADDGATWTSATLPATFSTGQSMKIAYGASIFVLGGGWGSAPNLASSPDGSTWTARSAPFDFAGGNIAFGNGYFVYAGNDGAGTSIYTSTNGTTWTGRAPGGAMTSQDVRVIFANGNFTLFYNASTTWTPTTIGNPTGAWTITTSAKPLATPHSWATIGTKSLLYSGNTISVSRDYVYFQLQNNSVAPNCLAYGNGVYFGSTATGSPAIYTINETTGVVESYWPINLTPGVTYTACAYVGTTYLLISSTTTRRSTDLITWTAGGLPVDRGSAFLSVANGIIYSFSSSAATTISYSTDQGVNWVQATGLVSAIYTGVYFAGGKYVLTSTTSNVHYQSSNGTSWTIIASGQLPTGIQRECVAHDGTAFYACGGGQSSVYRSTDAITWTLLSVVYRLGVGVAIDVMRAGSSSVVGHSKSSINDYISCSATGVYVRRSAVSFIASSFWAAGSGNNSAGLSTTAVRLIAISDQVLNDVNLKTYNATAAEQSDFYERVA